MLRAGLGEVQRLVSLTRFSPHAFSTLVARTEGAAGAGPSKLWNRVLWPLGLGLAATTDLQQPAHLIWPELAAGLGLASSGVLALALSRGLPGRRLTIAAHGLNTALQFYQLGRWATADVSADTPLRGRTRVVVVGSGWGAMTFCRSLDPRLTRGTGWYDITVISPRNYFLYTPLLPGAMGGSVEMRSIAEPVRNLLRGTEIGYNEAEVVSVDPAKQVVKCRYNKPFRNLPEEHDFELPYDVLVFATGSTTNTFRTPGVEEHAFCLKEAMDAQLLRQRVNECFELSSLPGCTREQRQRLLTFIVVGGGPTGVEAAAELHDMIAEDFVRHFPQLRHDVSVKLVETHDHLLSMYDRHISDYTGNVFARQGIDVVYNSRVRSVDSEGVVIQRKGEAEEKLVGGTTVWCTGVKMTPLTKQLRDSMPEGTQTNGKALSTDMWLEVLGSRGTIFALGDAATVEQECALRHAEELFREGDTDNSGTLSCPEIAVLMEKARYRYPQLAEHARYFDCEAAAAGPLGGLVSKAGGMGTSLLRWVPGMAQQPAPPPSKRPLPAAAAPPKGEQDTPGPSQQEEQQKLPARPLGEAPAGVELTLEQFKGHLGEVDKELRSLPATAQVATQQGQYLARVFNTHRVNPQRAAKGDPLRGPQGVYDRRSPPFRYRHAGAVAYIGADRAVMEVSRAGSDKKLDVFTGILAGLAWKGLETSKQLSWRTRYLVSRDWVKCKLFGRDISDV